MTPSHVGLTAAELVANRIRARPRARVLLPTGHTPRGLYAALRDHAADGSLPSERVTVLGLDEYLGLGADDPRSFRASLGRRAGRASPSGRREALDGAAADPEAEARALPGGARHRPVDLAVLGPRTRRARRLQRARLAARRRRAPRGAGPVDDRRRAAADFGGVERVPREALTVGLRTLLAARELLLIVTGAEKAEALHAGPRGTDRAGRARPRCCAAIRA